MNAKFEKIQQSAFSQKLINCEMKSQFLVKGQT